MKVQKVNTYHQCMTGEVRKKVIKWTRDFQKGKYAKAVEGKDYSIKVNQSIANPKTCDAYIICICGNSLCSDKMERELFLTGINTLRSVAI